MNEVKDGDTIVVWFSCGAASAIAAKETIRLYGDRCNVRIVNNPILDEDKDNVRFLKDVEKWLGYTIEFALNPKYPDHSCEQVWEDRKYMSGVLGAPCTLELKKNARKEWESKNQHEWLVLGFTSEERSRYDRFKLFERDNILPVLIDQEITKADCFNVLFAAGLRLPDIYMRGYPNANCIGCVKSQSPTYWNHVRENDLDIFERRVEQSRRIGARLVKVHPKNAVGYHRGEDPKVWFNSDTGEQITKVSKGVGNKNRYTTPSVRIFLDELGIDVKGGKLKNLDFECGIFCEEKQ